MMELKTPIAVQDLVHAIWSMAVGSVLGTSHVVAVAWWLERRCHQRWQQEQEARERLRALEEQLGLDSLSDTSREAIVASRRRAQAIRQWVQEILHKEQREA
jgi:hypothetical protein